MKPLGLCLLIVAQLACMCLNSFASTGDDTLHIAMMLWRGEPIDFRSPPAANLLELNLQQLIDDPGIVDGVLFPPDSFLGSRAHFIGAQLKEAKIPGFGSLKEYREGGLPMGIVVDYYNVGQAAAKIIDKHRKGKKLQDIPVVQPAKHPLYINKSTKELLAFPITCYLIKTSVIIH